MTEHELRLQLYKIADAIGVIREGLRGKEVDGQMYLLQLVEKSINDLALGAYKVIPIGGESDG